MRKATPDDDDGAGLVVEGENKWLSLMKAALIKKAETSN